MLRAKQLGFLVAKPWGDSKRYDFILGWGSRLWRVQLKCTQVIRARGYGCNPSIAFTSKGKTMYSAEEIDALVVTIPPIHSLVCASGRGAFVGANNLPVSSGHREQERALGEVS